MPFVTTPLTPLVMAVDPALDDGCCDFLEGFFSFIHAYCGTGAVDAPLTPPGPPAVTVTRWGPALDGSTVMWCGDSAGGTWLDPNPEQYGPILVVAVIDDVGSRPSLILGISLRNSGMNGSLIWKPMSRVECIIVADEKVFRARCSIRLS